MCGTTAWMQLTAPKKLTSNTRRIFSTLPSATVALSPSPALFTSTSMEPNSATARSTIANTASRSLTSVATTSRRPGRPASSSGQRLKRLALREASTTLLPARANRAAAARADAAGRPGNDDGAALQLHGVPSCRFARLWPSSMLGQKRRMQDEP